MYFILGYFQQNIDGNILWKLKKPSILSPFCPFKANKDFSGKSLDLYCCAEFQKKIITDSKKSWLQTYWCTDHSILPTFLQGFFISFRVISFEQGNWRFPNSSTDTSSLGILCGQSFSHTHRFVCGLVFCSIPQQKSL